ncbi:hypothetical protein [Candidatus Neptunochlamydia vexilliferae]|uniref:hypothetical protein n=1 Tax=Candidatus Neptunichlamydia vexilliferae TaxID=1651774 RepID=UPI0018916984|nr:hypothetical protein [Candidatus Neptunochlamydia vexilliferae]
MQKSERNFSKKLYRYNTRNVFITILFLVALSTLSAASVRIMNDSPYLLHAEVLSADGNSKGKLTIAPQQQSTWQDSYSGNNVWSQTPYTVILTCKNGKVFGVIGGIQQGATVTALSATGDLFCEPDKKQTQDGQQAPPEQPSPQAPQPADPSRTPGDPIWGPP